MKKVKLTVFTVNWNGKKWIDKFMQSINKQDFKNFELIIVDNASTDGSTEYIKKKYPKVKLLINNKNFGLAKAINIGFKYASAELVMFINNDTWFESDFLRKMYSYYLSNSYTAISPIEKRYNLKDLDRPFKCHTTIDILGSPSYYIPTYSRPEKIFYLTVCFLVKKNDFLNSGGMDESFFMYYEDVDWCWRMLLFKKTIAVNKSARIYHAGAGSSEEGIKYNFFLWRNKNCLQMLLKNYSPSMLAIILPLYFLQNIFEIIFFIILFNPKIAYTYILGWGYCIFHLKIILKKRKKIQNKRKVSDIYIMRKMFFGLGKFLWLRDYVRDAIGAKLKNY